MKKPSSCIAVVDIGSNSVRLVIYRRIGKHYVITKDRKETCRLAMNMHTQSPRLNKRGMKLTLATLRYFRKIIERSNVDKVLAIGTAAMRAVANTAEGKQFHRQAEKALNHKIKVISGRKEAHLTAQGVMSSLHDAKGICGDLGGGSLELATINRNKVLHTTTVALGTLTLLSEAHGDYIMVENLIAERMNKIDWLNYAEGKTFYAIGGTWRAIARIIMKARAMRPRMVHGYTISAKIVKRYALEIAQLQPADFMFMSSKIRDRADILPAAAAVLAQLIIMIKPSKITFSGHGVREGLIHEVTAKRT